jgi:hypothetical protein
MTFRTGSVPPPMPVRLAGAHPAHMKVDTSTHRLTHQHADRRCKACGFSISSYADLPDRCPMCSTKRPWVAGSRMRTAAAAHLSQRMGGSPDAREGWSADDSDVR